MPDLFAAPVNGAYHLVSWIASSIQPLTGPYAAALAIVMCTMAVRLLLLPLGVAAARGAKARVELMPKISEITKKHRDNPEKAQREIASLQAETGTSLFAGCLPMFAQLPFFWVLYSLFSTAIVAGEPNGLLSGVLFGAPLGVHWPLIAATPAYVGLAVLLAVVAFFSARWQSRQPNQPATNTAMGRAIRLLPYGTLATAAFIPLAAGLYLLTTTTWTVIERAILHR